MSTIDIRGHLIINYSTAGLVVFCTVQLSFAQGSTEGLAMKIAQVRKGNAALMKSYTWHYRTEFSQKGEVKDLRLELVNFGRDGRLQRSLISDQHADLPRGPLRKRIAEKEQEEMQKYLAGLKALLDQYTLPTAGKILDFVTQARLSIEKDGLIQLTGTGVVVPGDRLFLWVESASLHNRRMKVTTTYQGDRVEGDTEFKTTKEGLNYMATAVSDMPDKQIRLKVQNFDFRQSN